VIKMVSFLYSCCLSLMVKLTLCHKVDGPSDGLSLFNACYDELLKLEDGDDGPSQG
ncbi:hypothetical protein HAX54_030601, partial [Datura stramonium]|nr:hypothetical protein [Datura stramonium]